MSLAAMSPISSPCSRSTGDALPMKSFIVVSVNSLLELMQKYRPQERIQLEIRRGDKLQTISLQVESPPKALPNKGAETKGN
jgi:hypothetical protein